MTQEVEKNRPKDLGEFTRTIKQWLTANHTSYRQMSLRLGLDCGSISRMVKGSRISAPAFRKLGEAVGIETEIVENLIRTNKLQERISGVGQRLPPLQQLLDLNGCLIADELEYLVRVARGADGQLPVAAIPSLITNYRARQK